VGAISKGTFLAPFDQLRLRNWRVQVAIGAWPEELQSTQELRLDVRLRGDWSAAATSDRLEDALDYAGLREGVERWLTGRRWVLLEAFTSELCDYLLAVPTVRAVKVSVEKPAAQAPLRVSCTMQRPH